MAISDYLALKILDHIFGGADTYPPLYIPDAEHYIALCESAVERTDNGTTMTEVDFPAYARVQKANDLDVWEFATLDDGTPVKVNKVAIEFPQIDGSDPVTVSYCAILDAVTAGNILTFGALLNASGVPASRQFDVGDTPVFEAGELIVQIVE